MTGILKIIGLLASAGLFALAAFLASTPWRVHGGRFAAEYLMLGGALGLVALLVAVLSSRYL